MEDGGEMNVAAFVLLVILLMVVISIHFDLYSFGVTLNEIEKTLKEIKAGGNENAEEV